MTLVLSLFPGIGLLDLAFELEGYCTVRGPDVIWGGDIRKFHPPAGKFDGVIGGPPCQSFSSLVHLVRANGNEPKFGNLIPEFERCILESQPAWFVMENVPQAPEPVVEGYGVTWFMLDNSRLKGDGDGMFGQEQIRKRKWCFGVRGRKAPNLLNWIDQAVFFLPDADGTVFTNSGGPGSDSAANREEWSNRKTRGNDKPPSVRDKVRSGPVTAAHDSLENVTQWSKAKRKAVSSSSGGRAEDGTLRNARRYRLADALRLQGLPEDHLDHCPMTAEGKLKAVANGVPIMMGRAVAKAIREALTCA